MTHWPTLLRQLLVTMVCLVVSVAFAKTDTFGSSGNWTAPAGVTLVTVEAWGGGGAGGGAITNPGKGGGGAGGQYARKLLTVVPGQTYVVVAGARGTGSTGSGTAGGDSSFAATSVVAKGGAGGTNAANGVAGVGSTTGGAGDAVYAGGSGSSGSTAGAGGAGGGGAGSTGGGADASGLTGGLGGANSGGDGAGGLSSRGSGNSGNDFGGGGGGGYMTNSTTRSGGVGGKGQVQISYADKAPDVTTNAATAITAGGATLNGSVTSNGGSTTVTFEYGLTTGYGSTITAAESPAAFNASALAVTAIVTGLLPNTTYHFRAKGLNSFGAATGSDRTFTTTGPPSVTSINRASFDPTKMGASVSWTAVFSAAVTGVDATDFLLVQSGGVTGATIASVTGGGTTWTVTAGTGTGVSGTLGLKLVDDDSINSGGVALGGAGAGNGNFTGQIYTLIASVCNGAADILFCDDFERSNPGSVGNGWTVTPANAGNCSGTTGNSACAGIDSDIPPFNTYTNPRPNSTRAMFTRWAIVSVDSPVVSLSAVAGAQLSFWIRRGRDTFSECPEASGENYLVQYYASNNTWKTLAQYPSSPTAAACDGKIFTPTIELPPDALHAGFKMRFYQPSGSGDSGSGGAAGVRGYDYWHMDDIVIRKVTSPTYVGAFCDNFEAGLSRWSISAEDYSSGKIGDASIGSIAFQSANHELDMRWGYVTASTFKTNLTGVSGNITFWVKSGTGTGTLDPTTNENLVVDYLNSSGVWTTLKTYLGTLAGGSVDSFSVALPADAKHAGFRLRFRQVAGSGYDKSYWHIDDVCVGNAVATSDMGLTKTGDTTLIPGTNTSYTLKATNNGPDALSGAIQIIDTLPSGLTYLSGSGSDWTCSANAQIVTCNWSGSLANGALAPDLVITAAVGAGVTGSLTNTAVLSGTGNDPATGNNTASFTSGNFIPYFIFTNGSCVDGIAIGQSGQTCGDVAWTSMVAGQAKAGIYITAVNASRVPTKLSSSASTTVSTQFGLTCHDPLANAGVQATFTATAAALPLCTGNGADPTSWSNATSLTFLSGAPSVATSYTFTYADVGEVEMFMRNSVATTQVGKSGHFVVNPAGFVLSSIKCTTYAAGSCATAAIGSPGNNPGATTATGTAFIQAGQPFSVTVTAVNTSNVATPNFGQEQAPEGVTLDANLVLPSGGNAAALNNPSAFGNFVSGVATGTTFNWPEVGIINLTPSLGDGDYLGAGDVVGTTSGNVGRFIPDHFDTAVVQTGVTPATIPMACPSGLTCPTNASGASGMVYSGQPFSLQVTAKNAIGAGATTVNYQGSFARAVSLSAVAAVGSASTSPGGGALASTTVLAADFASGTLGVLPPGRTYTLPAYTGTPIVGPTDFYARAAESTGGDAVTSLQSVAASSKEAGLKVAYGRVSLPNVYGSELLPAACMTAAVQYFTGMFWTVSATDNASTLTLAAPVIVKGPLTAVGLTQSFASNSACAVGNDACGLIGAGMFCAGQKYIRLAPASVAGSANITLTVPGYLPSTAGRATFGIYKSPLIYRRENY